MDELQALNELFSSVDAPSESVIRRQKERLMTTIQTDDNARQNHHRRRMTGFAVVAATATLAAAGAAAAFSASQQEATEAAAFACVAEGTTAVLPNDGTPPLEACRSQWTAGNMVDGVTTAPPLIACVNAASAVEVIEGDGSAACLDAGLSEWAAQPAFEEMGSAVRDARIAFHDRYQATGNGCATEQEWREQLEDAAAASSWTIETDVIETGRECFDVASFDPTTRTVNLIGVPGDFSISCDPRTGC